MCYQQWEPKQRKRGCPDNNDVTASADSICNYLEESKDQCQFALTEILKNYPGQIPPATTLQKILEIIYCNDFIFTVFYSRDLIFTFSTTGKNQFTPIIIWFKSTGYTILTEKWYQSKLENEGERLRVVK
ncbi:hypothetical protein AVEN_191970-1 [Araneus ventricosus]|uniref:Uncharacterized protein n=1 Tax=Araneus ventricosus TaxID=182803 RepID=A0A4Y2L9M3_ARAVE|nr:hypothetical protein AVEN_191970-1 [Araneus ventricosus]